MRFIAKFLWFPLLAITVLSNLSACASSKEQNPNDSFKVILPQRAYWNSLVTVSVEAKPGTQCELRYITPKGKLSQTDGLGITTANESGACQWTWRIDEIEQKGSGRLILSVNGVSETHFIEIWSTD